MPELRHAIQSLIDGLDLIDQHFVNHLKKHEEAIAKAKAKKEEPPTWTPIRAQSSADLNQIAGMLDEKGINDWIRHEDLEEAAQDVDFHLCNSPAAIVSMLLGKLRTWPEFQTIAGDRIEVRWSRKVVSRRDLVLTETRIGRIKVVPHADRMTWSGSVAVPPMYRLELSLPYVLAATEEELTRGLHDLLMYAGHDGVRPVLRKPDIVAHSATLGRFGTQGIRETQAVAHAHANTRTDEHYVRFGFDPRTGQGLMWREDIARQQVLGGPAAPPAPPPAPTTKTRSSSSSSRAAGRA